jgi:hypothetical protein
MAAGELVVTQAEVENLKHSASWYNSLGIAVITTGFLAPLVASIVGLTGALGYLFLTNGVSVILGFTLHRWGSKFLEEIE